MFTALALLAFFVALGLSALARMRARQRDRQMPKAAATKGLHYAEDDPFVTLGLGFELLGRGDGRRVENVMWSEADHEPNGSQARTFDYGYYEIHHDRSGREVESWRWFSCAMAEPGGAWPGLQIEHERLRDKALELVGQDPIHFESDEFNQTFRVTSEDRRFASALIDPQMMQFLLETKGIVGFATRGRFLLVTSHQVAPEEMPILLGLADEFVRRIPAAAWELYPKVAPDTRLGPGDHPVPGPDAVLGPDGSSDPDQAWDPTPGVDYDLDGHPVTAQAEDDWHDHPLRPHDPRPPDRID